MPEGAERRAARLTSLVVLDLLVEAEVLRGRLEVRRDNVEPVCEVTVSIMGIGS